MPRRKVQQVQQIHGRADPRPPEPGTVGRILLQLLHREPHTAWPPGVLFREADISEHAGAVALQRLMLLQLVVRHWSDEPVFRVVLTPRGRRFRL